MWVRADGQPLAGNAGLAQKFELDHTACLGEMQKANLAGETYCPGGPLTCAVNDVQRQQAMLAVGKGCMADRGYTEVPSTAPNAAAGIPAGQR